MPGLISPTQYLAKVRDGSFIHHQGCNFPAAPKYNWHMEQGDQRVHKSSGVHISDIKNDEGVAEKIQRFSNTSVAIRTK